MEATLGTLLVALGTLLLLGGPTEPLPVPEPWGQAVTSLLRSLLPWEATERGQQATERGQQATERGQEATEQGQLQTWLQDLGTWLQRHPGRPQMPPRGPWGHRRAPPEGAWGHRRGEGTCPQGLGTSGTPPQGQGTGPQGLGTSGTGPQEEGTGPQGGPQVPPPPFRGQGTGPQGLGTSGTGPQWPWPPGGTQVTGGREGEGTGGRGGEGTRPQGHHQAPARPRVVTFGDIGSSRDVSGDTEESRGWGQSEEPL